jgi:FtsP/CotA-like multicopper oxidase with cupredoxin domain
MLPDGRLVELSRRTCLRMAGMSLAAWTLVPPALAQPSPTPRVLRLMPGNARLRGSGQPETPVWGFDGSAPGPLLRVKQREELVLKLANDLPEAVAIHWHGIRVPNALDGVPDLTGPLIEPGKTLDYRFRPPDAGTFWYRAFAPNQVDRGLYGLLIVEEAFALDIDRDIALVLDDWRLNSDGSIATDPSAGEVHLTANGGREAALEVRANERVRLRILNASTAQAFAVRMENHRPIVVAIDGQPAEPFAPRDARVVLAPGNRLDLVFDAGLQPGASAAVFVSSGREERALGRLAYSTDAPVRPAPRTEALKLPAPALPARMDFGRSQRAELHVDQGAKPLGSMPALLTAKRGQTVMLAFPNRTPAAYAIHVHGHHFRLLDAMDDGWKPYWLDTVIAVPGQTTRIAFVADNPGKWAVVCTRIGDGAAGAQRWFSVA